MRLEQVTQIHSCKFNSQEDNTAASSSSIHWNERQEFLIYCLLCDDWCTANDLAPTHVLWLTLVSLVNDLSASITDNYSSPSVLHWQSPRVRAESVCSDAYITWSFIQGLNIVICHSFQAFLKKIVKYRNHHCWPNKWRNSHPSYFFFWSVITRS